MSVIDLNLVCQTVDPLTRNKFKRMDNIDESRQINFLSDYGLFLKRGYFFGVI
jgi:hypothetical protein